MSAWQPIETAPKDRTILLWAKEDDFGNGEWSVFIGSWSTTAWYAGGGCWVGYEHRSDTEYLTATHWMDLPEGPNTEAAT